MRKLAIFSFSFAAATAISRYLLPSNCLLIIAAASLLLFAVSFLLKGKYRRYFTIITLAAAVGFAWNFAYEQLFFRPAAEMDGKTVSIEAELYDFPQSTDYGAYLDVKLFDGTAGGTRARAYVYDDSLNDLVPGDVIRFTADFNSSDHVKDREIRSYTSKGIFLFAGNVRDAEIISSGGFSIKYLHRYAARGIKEMCAKVFPLDTGGFMTALLTGDKTLINEDEELTSALSRTGVIHIVTVSGMHVTILSGFLYLLFGKRRGAIFAIIPVLLVFMGVSGFNASAVRAVIMQIFVLGAPLIDRENDSLTALSAALLMLLVINPYAVCGVGLQLSFAATLGIILFTPKLNAFFSRLLRSNKKLIKRLCSFISGSLSTTLAALVTTMPLVAVYFGYVSIIAPVVNVLIVWAVTPAFIAGAVAVLAGFISLHVGGIIGYVSAIAVKLIAYVVKAFSKLYFSAILLNTTAAIVWFVCLYICILVFIVGKLRARYLIAPACLLVLGFCTMTVTNAVIHDVENGFEMTVLDVGQGQSIVVTSGGLTAVIDCGTSGYENAGEIAEEYIRSLGRDKIDVLMLTHYHADHANGARRLMSCLDVGTLIVPEPLYEESSLDERILTLAQNNVRDIIYVTEDISVDFGDAVIKAFAPVGSLYENERGVCMLVSSGEFDVLVTGDIDAASERLLVMEKDIPDIEYLIVGHHGSRHSTSETFLDAVLPEHAVISVGENDYGHPTQEVLERLEERSISVARTDFEGNITIRSDCME